MLLLYRLCAVEAALTRSPMWLTLLLLLPGCWLRRGAGIDPLTAALERIDRAWAARATDGFEPVVLAVGEARRVGGKVHPEVLWREARLEVGQGIAADTDAAALEHYGAGRDAALTCMLADPEFSYSFRNEGMALALEKLSVARTVCAPWAAWSWSRSMVTLGGRATAIDRPRVQALVSSPRSLALAPDTIAHSELLLRTATAADERSLRALASDYEAMLRRRPQDLVLRSDLVAFVALPLGDRGVIAEQAEAVQRNGSSTPEDKASRARVLAAAE